MKDEDALLEAVLAAPNDDAPRLVYADFLQERGDPQGELIVVQCARERLEREEKTTTLEYREACWRERALLAGLHGDHRRGFRHRVSVATVADVRALATAPLAPLLETIVLRGDGEIELDAEYALTVAAALPDDEPLWQAEHGLPHPLLIPAVLGARYTVPTEQTIRELTRTVTPRMRALACLNGLRFTGNAFDDYWDSMRYVRLERFELWRISETEASFFIENAPPAAKHLTLVADDDRTQLWMGHAFRTCPALPCVRELHVSVAYELDDVARLSRESLALESWTAPDGIDDDAREAVARGPLTKRLRHLEMSFGGSPDVANLVTAPWERLTSLALGNARIGPELAKAPALESLVSLRLFGCKMAGDVESAIRARWPRVRIE